MRFAAVLVLLLVVAVYPSRARETDRPDILQDSISLRRKQKTNLVLDSLKTRVDNGALSRFLFGSLIKNGRNAKLEDERDIFAEFEGRRISSINIVCNDVYPNDSLRLHKFLNAVNLFKTARMYIRQNLFFKVGDPLSGKTLNSNEHFIRDLPSIVDAAIVARDDGEGGVEVWVITYDKWSVGAEALYSPSRESFITLYDKNFFGLGHDIRLRTNFFKDPPYYYGNQLFYRVSNLFGTFWTADFAVGKGYGHSGFEGQAYKDFILPDDYSAGVRYNNVHSADSLSFEPGGVSYCKEEFAVWGGKSWFMPRADNSFFLQGKLYSQYYSHCSLPLTLSLNPYYHNQRGVLLSAGIYKENFYKGRLIYGFGRTEDIPYGYNLTFFGGWERSQFNDRGYMGGSFTSGTRFRWGYVSTQVELGSFVHGQRFTEGVLNANLKSFSEMVYMHRCGLRFFLNAYYTLGFNRGQGEKEWLDFNREYGLTNLKNNLYSGNNRLVVNAEAVIFTPIDLLGFNMAFFGYMDMGWIGDERFLARTPMTVVGVGLRIKNDRFIIPNFQFSFGYPLQDALRDKVRFYRFSTEEMLDMHRFLPLEPNHFQYR